MHAEIRQVEGLVLLGKGDSNHWVSLDGPKIFKGQEAASRPMEMVLIALGGCLGMDVISLLGKKRVNLQNFRIELDAQQTEKHPRVFTQIDVKCILSGEDLKEDDVKWAIEKAREKYCPVGAMLEETTVINYSWEII